MATITVLDSTGATQTVAKVTATGSATSANSLPVVTASDDPTVLALGAPADTAAAADTTATTLIALLKRNNQNLTTLNTTLGTTNSQLPTVLGTNTRAASLSTVLATSGFSAAVTLTRTADTNAYLANDVIGAATGSTAALTFASIAPAAGAVLITTVSLQINDTAVISGEAAYRLHLYNVTPPSALGDNAAWDLPSGDRASYLGYVDFAVPADLGSTLYIQSLAYNKQITTAGTSIFGYLTTIAAYTPTSARVYVVTLNTVSL